MRNESDSKIEFADNLVKDVTNALVDPAAGNVHLAEAAIDAIDKAVPLPDVTEDIDRQARVKPDIGADELAGN